MYVCADVGLAELTGASVSGLTEQDRYVLADLYAMIISGSDSSIQFLEQHSSYLEYDITMGKIIELLALLFLSLTQKKCYGN